MTPKEWRVFCGSGLLGVVLLSVSLTGCFGDQNVKPSLPDGEHKCDLKDGDHVLFTAECLRRANETCEYHQEPGTGLMVADDDCPAIKECDRKIEEACRGGK